MRNKLLLLAALALAAAGTATGAAAASPAAAAAGPCGTATTPHTYRHVIWIWMENHGFSDVIGNTSQAPYINSLAGRCGLATNYHNVTHELAQLPRGHLRHRSRLATRDDLPGLQPLVVLRHDGREHLRAGRDLEVLRGIDDMHNGTVAQGDAWLARNLPAILDSRPYRAGGTAVFVTWDEGTGGYPIEDCDDTSTTDSSCRVATIVISPTTPAGTTSGTTSGTFFSHYSLLATTEQLLGLPRLGQASSSPTMTAAFHLQAGGRSYD